MNAVSLRSGKEFGIEEKQIGEKVVEKDKEEEKDHKPIWPVKEYKPKIPFPAKVIKDRMDDRFGKFLEPFK